MKRSFLAIIWLIAAAAFFTLGPLPNRAFPPAPDHVIYGTVRDELGNPLNADNAEVILQTIDGTQIKAPVQNGRLSGMNYQLTIPMDAGLTADLYKATAMQPTVPFKISVRIKGVRYLPIEMKGDYSHLGDPGKRTQLDLTLGEDSDGDGLPDAWERALIAALGGGLTLADIKPNDDSDHDGLTNMQEYLAGTYAFDPADGFSLSIVGSVNSNPVLEFLAIRGRNYKVLGSRDLKTWTPVSFRVSGTDAAGALSYYASDTRQLKIEAIEEPGETLSFFKLLVQ